VTASTKITVNKDSHMTIAMPRAQFWGMVLLVASSALLLWRGDAVQSEQLKLLTGEVVKVGQRLETLGYRLTEAELWQAHHTGEHGVDGD
jgi:hypothetical protein